MDRVSNWSIGLCFVLFQAVASNNVPELKIKAKKIFDRKPVRFQVSPTNYSHRLVTYISKFGLLNLHVHT
jgi:hypothetical protein